MLSSIHPFGERARNQNYGITATSFLVGSTLGGLALGAGSALAAAVLREVGLMPSLAMIALFAAAASDLLRIPLPSPRRQVDETWLARYRGWVYGLGFGFQLGVGFATYVKSALTYGFVLAAIMYGSPRLAVLSGVVFGLVRGLSIFLTAKIESPQQLRWLFSKIGETQTWFRVGGAFGVVVLGLVGLGGAL